MLRITVGGNALTLNDDTTISIEINNSMFESNVISGDITYTFSLPADANNNKILGFANNMSMVRQKQRCTIGIDNITIVDGELWIQHADSTHYEVGVVVNPYPLDFGEKKLTDDDFGDDIIISDDLANHQQNWLTFLQNTKESEIIKFPLFVAENLYGDANPEFGYIYDDSGDQHQASLVVANDNVSLQKYYVNRLFFNGPNVYNGDLGLRVFNKPAINGQDPLSGSFTFCPAFSLLFLLRKVIETAGYTLIGDIVDDDDFKTLLVQSLRTLDGKCDDYNDQALARVSNVEDFDANSQLKEDVLIPYYVHNGDINDDTDPAALWSDGLFTASADGNYIFVIKLNYLVYYSVDKSPYTDNEGCYHQFVINTCIGISTDAQEPQPLQADPGSQQSITSEAINCWQGDIINTEITLTAELQAGQRYKVWLGRFEKETITRTSGGTMEIEDIYKSNGIYNKSNCSVLMAGNSDVANYNIFTNKIKTSLFMPDVSNSEFINAIKDAFGLTFYIDARSMIVEMSYAKKILEARKALDLTPYLLNEETYIDESDDKQFSYTLPPASDNEIDENSMIDPVDRYLDLPNPTTYLGKCCYVRGYNMIFKAERLGNAASNWEYKWVPVAGNNQYLVIGEGKDSEKISPKLKIGSMTRVSDSGTGIVENNYKLPCTEETGVSPLYDTGTTSFDMIILRYLGVQKLSSTLPTDNNGIVPQLYIELASPVCYDVRDSIMENGLSGLTTLGDNSIGEKYIRPLLDFRTNSDTVVCQFLLPISILLQVIVLVRPQTIATSQQVRWCFVQNQRMIPRKITFEIRADDSRIKAEIEFAKKRNNDL